MTEKAPGKANQEDFTLPEVSPEKLKEMDLPALKALRQKINLQNEKELAEILKERDKEHTLSPSEWGGVASDINDKYASLKNRIRNRITRLEKQKGNKTAPTAQDQETGLGHDTVLEETRLGSENPPTEAIEKKARIAALEKEKSNLTFEIIMLKRQIKALPEDEEPTKRELLERLEALERRRDEVRRELEALRGGEATPPVDDLPEDNQDSTIDPTMTTERPDATEPEVTADTMREPEEQAPRARAEREPRDMGQVADYLSETNQGFFKKLSTKAKSIAHEAYEGLYKTPGISRVVGKMEIAYNQRWINRHETKAVEKKGKMEDLDIKVEALDSARRELEATMEDLRAEGLPRADALQLKLKVLDEKKKELLDKRDKVQSIVEERSNQAKVYTNKRDQVADKLIHRYEGKLEPMEKELEQLQTCKDELDLQTTVAEVIHNDKLARLRNIEARKVRIEGSLRATGMSEKQIRKNGAIKELENLLSDEKSQIRSEQVNLREKKLILGEKIAKVDKKANPWRDRREQFVRVKESRPINMELPTRERAQAFEGTEEVTIHPRQERRAEATTEPRVEAGAVNLEEDEEEPRDTVANYLARWNTVLSERNYQTINPRDFTRATRRLSENRRLRVQDFEKILKQYYKLKKMSAEQFSEIVTSSS